MDLSVTLAVAGIILALLWFGGKKRQRLPPGPFALPLIGNLPQLEKKAPFKSFVEVSSMRAFMCMDLGPLSAQGFTWFPDLYVFIIYFLPTAEQNLRSSDDVASGLAADRGSGGIRRSEGGSGGPCR